MESQDNIDLQEVHDFLIDIAYKAGKMITGANPSLAGTKKNSTDLVTETDKRVEDFVSSSLREKYPDYDFMGEETYKPGDRLTKRPTFVVDPIDGTCNFLHSYDYVSISLGFTVDRVPVVGVVFNPFTKKLYSAVKGQGAFLNHNTRLPLKIEASTSNDPNSRPLEPLKSLSDALVAVEWGADREGPDWEIKIKTFAKLCASKESGGSMVHSIRSLGSAAINLCAVAEASLDVYWEAGCYAWDFCAGMAILREAGGMVVDGNAGNWDAQVDDRRYLAVRKGTDRSVVEEFWSQVQGTFSYKA
ncbi:MAG: hypothetical protein M1828_003320 [Chrysothrix sp. TS-e1954]|nr:MAG: hypothetical protein M1828_003320 [Chrysothrix sp. TS-e1954]